MNVRLQYDLEFLGGIYFEEQMQMNHYSVSLNLVTGTANPTDTNIAMDRIKAFVFGELEHSVFINVAQRERAELMHLMGINVTTLPEEPVDQIIGMMLYYKLNSDANIVKVVPDAWTEYGLAWPGDTTETGNTVVFGNFPKNEN